MKTVIAIIILTAAFQSWAQLSIARNGSEAVVSWTGDNWILQASEGGGWQNVHREPATNHLRFFRLVAVTNMVAVVTNHVTNDFVVALGSNIAPSMVLLAALTDELPTHPVFKVLSGQARIHPHDYSPGGALRMSESRGNYDLGVRAYCTVVEIQDPITTPLLIRVLGPGYEAYARFTNP